MSAFCPKSSSHSVQNPRRKRLFLAGEEYSVESAIDAVEAIHPSSSHKKRAEVTANETGTTARFAGAREIVPDDFTATGTVSEFFTVARYTSCMSLRLF